MNQSTSGAWPRLSNTEETLETLPLARSISTLTVPSVAETTTLLTPGNRLVARVAFIAQSGQSIPSNCHSNSSAPSTTNSASIMDFESRWSPAIGSTFSREPSSSTNSSFERSGFAIILREPVMIERTLSTTNPINP